MRRTAVLVLPLSALMALGTALPATAAPALHPPTVSLSASAYTVSEAAGHATITATRHGAGRAVSVTFATYRGTAVPGRDYRYTRWTLTIPAGSTTTSRQVPVPIIDNAVADPDRSFTVALENPSRYALAWPARASVTIVNDDVPVAPAGLSAGPVGSTEIDLSWTANSDYVTGYRVLRSTTTGGPYTEIGQSSTTGYHDTGLAAGTYYYVVQAVDPAGNSPSSGEATATLVPAQTELISNGGFENGLTAGWYVPSGPGYAITLDSTAPHSGSNSAHFASDGSQQVYPGIEGSFIMPSSGTVTFSAWYKAAFAGSDWADIALYDYDAQTYISDSGALGSAAGWTQTTPVSFDASTMAGHYILIVVDMQASGASTWDVDDFSATVG